MGRKYFGTDGIRGEANKGSMTADMALRIGQAAGQYFSRSDGSGRVVIGKDTRRSGYMLENALTAGLTSVGMDVFLFGPVPTPAVGMLTRSMRADVGVMISASHNPFQDNGIKFFGPDGYKLSDKVETDLEAILDQDAELAEPLKIGSARRFESGRGRYQEFVKTAFPREQRLDGLKIVVDCANGAAYRTAPQVLWELGAEVIPIGVEPNGFNINENCGSTHPETCAARVLTEGADLGISLDGDADRVMIIDEKGQVADGDQIMGLIASNWASHSRLAGNTLVSTVMSNLGLEQFLNSRNIKLLRTGVGDRYVVEAMRQGGYNLGGEQSGHIVFRDFVTTGDGLLGALQFLAALVDTGKAASELCNVFAPCPQVLENVRYSGGDPLAAASVIKAIKAGEDRFGSDGRLVIRKSGTEPLVRIMGECNDPSLLNEVVMDIRQELEAAL